RDHPDGLTTNGSRHEGSCGALDPVDGQRAPGKCRWLTCADVSPARAGGTSALLTSPRPVIRARPTRPLGLTAAARRFILISVFLNMMRESVPELEAPFRLPEAPVETDLVAKYFRGLGEPTRLRILELLRDEGELSVGELVRRLAVPQPKVSNHLAGLRWCCLL